MNASARSILPRLDGRALDFAKAMAAVLMVVDHINTIWFDGYIMEMVMLGRVVFPVFCYAVAVALLRNKAKDHTKYFTSLIILAFLCEPVYEIAHLSDELNIIFTLAFGVFVADRARKLKDWQIYLLFAVAAVFAALHDCPLEFGLPGVLLPTAILLVLECRYRFIPGLVLMLFAINLGGVRPGIPHLAGHSMISVDAFKLAAVTGAFAALGPLFIIVLSNELPKTGRFLSRYFLHVFYPAHLLIIWALGLYFFPLK